MLSRSEFEIFFKSNMSNGDVGKLFKALDAVDYDPYHLQDEIDKFTTKFGSKFFTNRRGDELYLLFLGKHLKFLKSNGSHYGRCCCNLAYRGRFKVLVNFLDIEHPHLEYNLLTTLMCAIRGKRLQIVKYLCEKRGVDPTKVIWTCPAPYRPIDVVSEQGNAEIADYILNVGKG